MRALLLAGVVALVSTGTAHAAVWTASASRSGQFYGGNIDDIYVQGFNPSLGTINSITAFVLISIQDRLTYFTDSNSDPVQAITNRFSFFLPGSDGTYSTAVTYGTGQVEFNGNGTETVTTNAITGITKVVVSQNYLANYSDGSFFDFVNVFGYSTLTGRPNAFENSIYGVSATATVTVDYTPIPEPASLALLGMGLAGAGALRRRRAA